MSNLKLEGYSNNDPSVLEVFIPDYENATKQIQKDTYRAENWSLKPFEFRYGFAVHFGLDF